MALPNDCLCSLAAASSAGSVAPARAKQAVMKTVEYAQAQMGEQAWTQAMNPEKAVVQFIDNPYTYTKWDAGSAQWKR